MSQPQDTQNTASSQSKSTSPQRRSPRLQSNPPSLLYSTPHSSVSSQLDALVLDADIQLPGTSACKRSSSSQGLRSIVGNFQRPPSVGRGRTTPTDHCEPPSKQTTSTEDIIARLSSERDAAKLDLMLLRNETSDHLSTIQQQFQRQLDSMEAKLRDLSWENQRLNAVNTSRLVPRNDLLASEEPFSTSHTSSPSHATASNSGQVGTFNTSAPPPYLSVSGYTCESATKQPLVQAPFGTTGGTTEGLLLLTTHLRNQLTENNRLSETTRQEIRSTLSWADVASHSQNISDELKNDLVSRLKRLVALTVGGVRLALHNANVDRLTALGLQPLPTPTIVRVNIPQGRGRSRPGTPQHRPRSSRGAGRARPNH